MSNLSLSSYWNIPLYTCNFICQQSKDENHVNKDENQQDFVQAESVKHEETRQGKSENNLMSSFAEKALSVAGPVVPTKGDGEVDHERSVNVTVVFFVITPSLCFLSMRLLC